MPPTTYTLVEPSTEKSIRQCRHSHRTPEAAAECNAKIQRQTRLGFGKNARLPTKPLAREPMPKAPGTAGYRELTQSEQSRYYGFSRNDTVVRGSGRPGVHQEQSPSRGTPER